jgi:hypothetical protein
VLVSQFRISGFQYALDGVLKFWITQYAESNLIPSLKDMPLPGTETKGISTIRFPLDSSICSNCVPICAEYGKSPVRLLRWSRLFGQFSQILKWKLCSWLGRRWFWRTVGVDRDGDIAIVPVLIDQQGQFIAF